MLIWKWNFEQLFNFGGQKESWGLDSCHIEVGIHCSTVACTICGDDSERRKKVCKTSLLRLLLITNHPSNLSWGAIEHTDWGHFVWPQKVMLFDMLMISSIIAFLEKKCTYVEHTLCYVHFKLVIARLCLYWVQINS